MIRTDITLDERAKIMDIGITGQIDAPFSSWIEIIRKGTDLHDDAIMAMSDEDILKLGTDVIGSLYKKK